MISILANVTVVDAPATRFLTSWADVTASPVSMLNMSRVTATDVSSSLPSLETIATMSIVSVRGTTGIPPLSPTGLGSVIAVTPTSWCGLRSYEIWMRRTSV
ncbi:MAG: hypothetical protein DRJ28_01500 [Actinobacteria bacterium]|nr:MAG: hypothetical protein DRJ28_01500 [Actinomycetota bacterium]